MTLGQQKRFEARARTAKLRHLASVEDMDYRRPAASTATLFLKLAGCDWIHEHRPLPPDWSVRRRQILVWLAPSAEACRGKPLVAVSARPRLFTLLALGRGDGRYTKLMRPARFASTYSFSTIGVRNRCCPSSSAIYWRSSKIATMPAALIITSQLPVDR